MVLDSLHLSTYSSGNKLLGYNDAFMSFLENHSTGKLYPEMTNQERVVASTATGNLHWTGFNVVVDSASLSAGRHPSGHVEMYAPASQQAGSSVSHFSTSLFPNQLMEPSYTGPTHDFELTVSLMKDIGWLVNTGCTGFVDSDGDGWLDSCDNCIEVANPDQRDTNGDGYGNICDTDLDNDGITSATDIAIFRPLLLTPDPDADFDGDGIVSPTNIVIIRSFLLHPPGPSGLVD